MPAQETSLRLQKAVLWPSTGFDAYGQFAVGSPVEIDVRWNDVFQERVDARGNTITIVAKVVVIQDISIGSRMWLGRLADLLGTALVPEADWCEVKTFNSTPDARNRARRRTVDLMRYKGPTSV